MRTPSHWEDIVAQNPDHSHRYLARMRGLAAAGNDLAGEARLVDAMLPRGSRVLDAGSGPGRVGGELAARGHTVVGVDIDPLLVAGAHEDFPGITWLVGDIADMDLSAHGVTDNFDAIVCAGNVMAFLGEGTHVSALTRMRTHLAPGGRVIIGFGAGRGYLVPTFLADVDAAGLTVDATFSTWDLRPYTDDAGFIVAILSVA